MARFTDFLYGAHAATWTEAIGEVLGQAEDQRQLALASIYLSTGALSEIQNRYGALTGTTLEPGWELETVREHLQEIIQAALMLSSSRAGVSQVVAATTMVPPVIKSIELLRRWLLGFQYLPNRQFRTHDATIYATVDEPYTIDETNNQLFFTVNGGALQRVVLPTGEEVLASEIIDAINSVLDSATARPYGLRFLVETISIDASSTIQLDTGSTALDVLGLDTYEHQNAPAPSNMFGSLPTGWRLLAPNSSLSDHLELDGALFGVAAPQMLGTRDAPFVGLIDGSLLRNPGFEDGFDGWDNTDGQDFYISTTKFRSGNNALGIITSSDTNTLRSERLLVIPGHTLELQGFHQASSSPSEGSIILDAELTAGSSQYTWAVSNSVYRIPHLGITPLDTSPLASTLPSPITTLYLFDPTKNFLSLGVAVGMAVEVILGASPLLRVFGKIVGLSVYTLGIDIWRGPTGAELRAGPFQTTIVDDFLVNNGGVLTGYKRIRNTLGIDLYTQAGVRGNNNALLADKIEFIYTTPPIPGVGVRHQHIVRDIKTIAGQPANQMFVSDLGGVSNPPALTPFYLYPRPSNGTGYRVWTSLEAAMGADNEQIGAKFKYSFIFYDRTDTAVSSVDTGVLEPDPSTDYSEFTLETTVPADARSAEVTIEVSASDAGAGAVATVDDIQATLETEGVQFHVAGSDGRMQIVDFTDASLKASGTIHYTAAPADGDRIRIGSTTYEFDVGALSSGLINYSGQPADGDTVTIGSIIYEFDSNSTVSSGHIPVTIQGSDDLTFGELVTIINLLDTNVRAVQNTTANTVLITFTVPGPVGDAYTFLESSSAITLQPVIGTLFGGSAASYPSGVLPIFTYPPGQNGDIDVPYEDFANTVNAGNSEASAEISTAGNVVTISARQPGSAGETVVFSGVSSISAYTLTPSNPQHLTGSSSQFAGGTVTFVGLPADGDSVIIDGSEFEFDNNGSGLCPGAIQVVLDTGPSGVANTAANLLAAINSSGTSVATIDASTINVTTLTPGSAGNSQAFRSDSLGLTLQPDDGDKSAQTPTATAGTSRDWAAAVATYVAANTPPLTTSIGTAQTLSSVASQVVTITTAAQADSRIIVCVATPAAGATPTVTDSAGNVYTLDASRTTGTGRAYIFSALAQDGLAVAATVTVAVSSGTLDGVATSVLAVFNLCRLDAIADSSGTGTALTVGPTAALDVSGEFVVALFAVLGPATDVFTAGPGYLGVGRVGTGAGANQVTANPEIRNMPSATLTGGSDSPFADPSQLTCAEVAGIINAQVSGIVAGCEITDDFPDGRLTLTALSGVSCVIIGHGNANTILGFEDDVGACITEAQDRIPGWEVLTQTSGVIQYITRATEASRKFFGTNWHARFWAASSSNGQEPPSGLVARAIMTFDDGNPIFGDMVHLSRTPQVVEVVSADTGERHEEIEVQLMVSGVVSGLSVVISDPYLINETSKSLHLASHTIPRNKQREHRMHRAFVSSPDPFTPVEFGLLGLAAHRTDEPLVLEGIEFTRLPIKQLVDGSELVRRAGRSAFGEIIYTGNPGDGDVVIVGDETYEFDNNFSIGTGSVQVILTPDPDSTMSNLVEQINSNSIFAAASIDTTTNTVIIRAQTPGIEGDNTLFATATSGVVFTLVPDTGKFAQGEDPTDFERDVDYEIDYQEGKVRRKPGGAITDPSPDDLVIDFSYSSAGIDPADSYPQRVKAVGSKFEPDTTNDLLFYGTYADFTNVSGIYTNLTAIERTPSRFSYLKPVVRGLYQQVITFSGIGQDAWLDYEAEITDPGILLRDGIPVPAVSGVSGWHFTADGKRIHLASGEWRSNSVYEVEYSVRFRAVTGPIAVEDTTSPYILVPYSFKARNAEETLEDVERVLQLDEDRVGKLVQPAVQDKSLCTLIKLVGGVTSEVQEKFWRFIDDTNIEILLGTFEEAAIFTFRYKSARINFVTPIEETWEYATASGLNLLANEPWSTFDPGDVAQLSTYVKFRVTAHGDFDTDDYRVRSFAAIVDTSELTTCGYGLGGYGLTPYGCGFDVEDDEPVITQGDVNTAGSLFMDGEFTLTVLNNGFGVIVINSSATGALTASTVNPFAQLCSASGGTAATVAAVQSVVPIANATFKSFYVRLSSALTGGGTATFRLNKNGVNQSGLSVTIASGNSSGNALGSVAVVEGDLIAIEVTFTGGTTSASIQHMTLGYEAPKG